MEQKQENKQKLFYDCRDRCSAMHRSVENIICLEPPSLNTLQKV